MPAQFPPSLKRRMPGSLARVRRYLEESWGSLQPMDNPPGYDEALGVTAKEDKPRRWRSPLEHARTWQRAFKSWQNSFDYDKFTLEGGLGRGLVRGEAGDRADEALKNGWSPEAARVLVDGDEKEVESLVREKLRGCRTELTEEEVKEEVARLRKELRGGRGKLEAMATDRMDLLRITMQEFVSGYKEGRDHSAEEIQAAMTTQIQSFKSLFLEGEWTAETIEENKQKNLRALKEAFDQATGLSEADKKEVEEEVGKVMKAFDESATSEEVQATQRQVEEMIRGVGKRVGGAVRGAVEGARAKE